MPFKNRHWVRDSSPHTHTHSPPPPYQSSFSPHHFWAVLFVTESGRGWWGEMPCEPVICQKHSVWHVSGRKITLEWCYHVFNQSDVEAALFSSLKLCHCQYYHSWWCFKLLFTRGLKFRNARRFPMTVVTVHWGKLEQESSHSKSQWIVKALLTSLCSSGSECPYNAPAHAGVIGDASLFTPLSYKDWASTEVNKECFITGRWISPMKFCWTCNVHVTYIASEISSNNMMDQHLLKPPRSITKAYTKHACCTMTTTF